MIDGVVVHALETVINDRGGLLEIQRRDDPLYPGFGQVYVTLTLDGVVKAWYRHRSQIDQIAAVSGRIELVLFDDRAESASSGTLQRVVMGQPTPCLVQIPPGVWHGFRAVDGDALLVHLNSEPFRFDDPDEDRLAPDDPSIPHRW